MSMNSIWLRRNSNICREKGYSTMGERRASNNKDKKNIQNDGYQTTGISQWSYFWRPSI